MSSGADKSGIDKRTHGHAHGETDAGNNNIRMPKLASDKTRI